VKPLNDLRRIATAAVTCALLTTASTSGRGVVPPVLVSAAQESEPVVAISFISPHAPRVVVAEQRMLAVDVNAERVRRGLAELVPDANLDRFAYAKALDMASRAYFGHTNPDGVTFTDRLRAFHWPNPYAAENIAFDRDEPHAHAAFMNSPPHARNLLDPNEHRIGIAVVTVQTGETFYVEDFSA
jgi:uncharacterized protein YkwD